MTRGAIAVVVAACVAFVVLPVAFVYAVVMLAVHFEPGLWLWWLVAAADLMVALFWFELARLLWPFLDPRRGR